MTVIEGGHDQLCYGVWPALTLRCMFTWRSTLHGERGGLLRVKIVQQETNHSPLKYKCLPSRQGQDHCLWALETCPKFLPRKLTAIARDPFLTADIPLQRPSLRPLGGESHGVRVGAVSRQTCPCPLWDSAATATPPCLVSSSWESLSLLRVRGVPRMLRQKTPLGP